MRTSSHSPARRSSVVSLLYVCLDFNSQTTVRRYVIERDLLGIGNLAVDQLNRVRKESNLALSDAGPGIQWIESYVTDNRMYCLYLAENVEMVREHARRAGLPCTKVSEVRSVVDSFTVTPQARSGEGPDTRWRDRKRHRVAGRSATDPAQSDESF